MKKNKYGQYFTPDEVADFMVCLSDKDKDDWILEPSAGKGVFLNSLYKKGYKNIISYEIDKSLKNVNHENTIYESFINAEPKKKFDLIIGNPPYIRWKNLEKELREELQTNHLWKKYFNSLCDYLYIFILKSITLLKEEGELIFICPDYWMQTTHSESLRNFMMSVGGFEIIIRFNETKVFSGVNSSLMIFKFKRTKKPLTIFELREVNDKKITLEKALEKFINKDKTITFKIPQFEVGKRWILGTKEELDLIHYFENSCSNKDQNYNLFKEKITKYQSIGDYFDVANGMVSGFDKIFKIEESKNLNKIEKSSLINVIKGKNIKPYFGSKSTKYFLINNVHDETELNEEYPFFFEKLIKFKEELNKRYNYGKEIPYWHWVFLRNINFFKNNVPKIFIPVKNRISKNKFFKFTIVDSNCIATQDVIGLVPKKGVRESLEYSCALLNSKFVFQWTLKKGVVKGNIVEFVSAPLKSIPFRPINWENKREVAIHDEITNTILKYEKEDKILLREKIDALLIKLFDQNESSTQRTA